MPSILGRSLKWGGGGAPSYHVTRKLRRETKPPPPREKGVQRHRLQNDPGSEKREVVLSKDGMDLKRKGDGFGQLKSQRSERRKKRKEPCARKAISSDF